MNAQLTQIAANERIRGLVDAAERDRRLPRRRGAQRRPPRRWLPRLRRAFA